MILKIIGILCWMFVLTIVTVIFIYKADFELNYSGQNRMEIMIDQNRGFKEGFSVISNNIDNFIKVNQRLPSRHEMDLMEEGQTNLSGVSILRAYGHPSEEKKLGPVPSDSYLILNVDRNGGAYYYAAWSGSVNFPVKIEEIYFLHSKTANIILWTAITVVFSILLLSVWIYLVYRLLVLSRLAIINIASR